MAAFIATPIATALAGDQSSPSSEDAALRGGAGLFTSLDPAAVAAVSDQLRLMHFASRQTVYTEGEIGRYLYIVVSGKIKLGCHGTDGRTHLLAVLGPAEFFGELAILDPSPQTSTATAVTDVTAWSIDGEVLRRWVTDHPEVAERLLRVLARRLRRTDSALCDLVFSDVAGRTATALLRLAQQFGVQEDNAVRVKHDLTQDELGQLVGASREAVNKALGEFAQRGWIQLGGKTLLIFDLQRLVDRARLAAAPPPITAIGQSPASQERVLPRGPRWMAADRP